MRTETKAAFDNILSVITCDDGGVQFTHFKSLIVEMDRQAEEGNAGAEKVLDILRQFSRMVSMNIT